MPVDEKATKKTMVGYPSYEVWARRHAGGSEAFRHLWDNMPGRARKREDEPEPQESPEDS